MKKQLLTITLTLLATVVTFAQEVWYDVDNTVTDLTFSTTCDGCSVSTVANPDATDTETTNVLLWKIAAESTLQNKDLSFSFPSDNGLKPADFTSLVVTVRLYMPDITNYSNFDELTRIRLYLGTQQVQVKLSDLEDTDVNGWYTLAFDFSGKTYTENVIDGYIRILGQSNRFTNLDNDIDFHFDTITSNVALSELAAEEEEEEEEEGVLDAEAVLDAGNEWYHHYSPDVFSLTVNEVLGGVFLAEEDAVDTPTTTGNSSEKVAKFTKEDETSSQVKFQLPGLITTANQASAIFKIRAYVPSSNVAPSGGNGRRFRLFLRDGDLSNSTQKNITIDVTVFDAWQEYTFDFTEANLTADSYSTVNLLFDQPDAEFASTGNVYYLDAFQGPSAATLPTNNIELNSASIVAYPNPATDRFQLTTNDVTNISVYNINGQLVKTFTQSDSYDISNLAAGLYSVNINTISGSKTIKLIKK